MAGAVRLLVTGFTPFPGAPVNPTERLIRHFEADPPFADEEAEFRFAVLPVDYDRAVPALEAAARGFDPHVAIHFGLAGETSGFRLETLARNEIAARIPDNSGRRPPFAVIAEGGAHVASTLPLADIAAALEGAGLEVSMSDDAGGYLCNYVFYHSAAGLCAGTSASMSGFVHVGPVALPGVPSPAMTFDELRRGAEIVIATCMKKARADLAARAFSDR